MLDHMPTTALIRNLGKMASIGMHKPLCNTVRVTVGKLTDPVAISKSRIHPLTVVNALYVYKSGGGIRGSLQWNPNMAVVDALEEAFYMAFKNVDPTGKNIMLALDVSGSMGFADSYPKGSMLNASELSAVLSMVTLRTEKNAFITGFTGSGKDKMLTSAERWDAISMLPIRKQDGLDTVIKKISNLAFGSTDCALPMLYCKHLNVDVDAIVIYTDNETWSGDIHPWQALEQYEQHIGHSVKLVVVGMTATEFSIAKPDAPNMLDVVGFDTNTPAVISNFIK